MAGRRWGHGSFCVATALLALGCVTAARAADFSTLVGKHIVGYQGWFGCPSDPVDPRWSHWFHQEDAPGPKTISVDLWPDLSEFDQSELCPTGMTLPSGEPAFVFSSENEATVRRHFRWMREYGIDGATVQRFVGQVAGSPSVDSVDLVLRNIRAAAEAENRGFFVMYDVSGGVGEHPDATIEKDWRRLDAEGLTASPSYMRHLGRPVVAVWGLGFRDRQVSAQQVLEIIHFFKDEAKVTLFGGVPAHWRTLDGDSRRESEWAQIYRSFDVLSPWTVGRFRNPRDADAFARDLMAPDIAEARAHGQAYAPVIFPGFSWRNLKHGGKPLDRIPRLCGALYREQADNALRLGADIFYSAMFDELDEGTALMKVIRSSEKLPSEAALLAPDAGQCADGDDLYLTLVEEVSRRLHEIGGR